MAISTKKNAASETFDKKAKIALLMKQHEKLFHQLNVKEPYFIPKVAYVDKEEKVIGFFENELEANKDVYIEFVTTNYDAVNEHHILYKFVANPHYKTEYRKTDPHPLTGSIRYLVPVDELHNITELLAEPDGDEEEYEDEVVDTFDPMDPDTDVPISQMTIKDFYAIVQNKPVASQKFLNDLIKANQ